MPFQLHLFFPLPRLFVFYFSVSSDPSRSVLVLVLCAAFSSFEPFGDPGTAVDYSI